jgi:hypothetical protein
MDMDIDHDPLRWGWAIRGLAEMPLAGGFKAGKRCCGRTSLAHPLFKPTYGSMTRFVLIAAQSVKDFFVHISLFSYVIGITRQLCPHNPLGPKFVRVQTIL